MAANDFLGSQGFIGPSGDLSSVDSTTPWWGGPLIQAGGSLLSNVLMGLLFPPKQPKVPRQTAPLPGAGFQMAMKKYLGG